MNTPPTEPVLVLVPAIEGEGDTGDLTVRLSIDLYLPPDWDNTLSDEELREWAVERMLDAVQLGLPPEAFDVELLPLDSDSVHGNGGTT